MSKKLKSRKSWREKLENPPEGLPKVVNGPAKWEKRLGGRRRPPKRKEADNALLAGGQKRWQFES